MDNHRRSRTKNKYGVQLRAQWKQTLLTAASAALFICSLGIGGACAASQAPGGSLCEREMTRAAAKYGVPLGVLYAVGMTESGKRGMLSPYALNIQGPSFFPVNLDDALQQAEEALHRGVRLIDIGCMQINHYYHADAFSSLTAMFDPHQNVDYAARLLKKLRDREGNWTLAAARYHAGPDNNAAQAKYVCRVIENMVDAGFGGWTDGSRAFCKPFAISRRNSE